MRDYTHDPRRPIMINARRYEEERAKAAERDGATILIDIAASMAVGTFLIAVGFWLAVLS